MKSTEEILIQNIGLDKIKKPILNAISEFAFYALDEVLARVFYELSKGQNTEEDFNKILLATIRDIKNEIR